MSEAVSTSVASTPTQGSSSPAPQGAQAATAKPQGNSAPFTQGSGAPKAAGKSTDPNSFEASAGKTEAPAPRKLSQEDDSALVEITVDGQKQEVTLAELRKLTQLEKVSKQRMNEVHRERQRIQQQQALMKQDPERYMKEVMGIDPDEWSESRVVKKFEQSQMTPEQRRIMELENENNQIKTREQRTREPLMRELKNLVSEQEYQQLEKEAPHATTDQIKAYLGKKQAEFQSGVDSVSEELLEAWQKTGLPKQKDFGSWIAQVMVDHQKKAKAHKERTGEDLAPLQPAEAAAKVKTRFLNSTRSMFSQMDAKAIQDALGEDVVKKLREHDVAQVSNPQTPPWASGEQKTLKQPDPKLSMNEFEYRHWNRTGEYPARYKKS